MPKDSVSEEMVKWMRETVETLRFIREELDALKRRVEKLESGKH